MVPRDTQTETEMTCSRKHKHTAEAQECFLLQSLPVAPSFSGNWAEMKALSSVLTEHGSFAWPVLAAFPFPGSTPTGPGTATVLQKCCLCASTNLAKFLSMCWIARPLLFLGLFLHCTSWGGLAAALLGWSQGPEMAERMNHGKDVLQKRIWPLCDPRTRTGHLPCSRGFKSAAVICVWVAVYNWGGSREGYVTWEHTAVATTVFPLTSARVCCKCWLYSPFSPLPPSLDPLSIWESPLFLLPVILYSAPDLPFGSLM